jgi:uncharacterized lipoprotein YajG
MTTSKILAIALALASLTGCMTAQQPPAQAGMSPCAVYQFSYECQVEQYHRVP